MKKYVKFEDGGWSKPTFEVFEAENTKDALIKHFSGTGDYNPIKETAKGEHISEEKALEMILADNAQSECVCYILDVEANEVICPTDEQA